MYDRSSSMITTFLLGGAIGAVLGILYAPRPGAETRAAVSDKVSEYWGEGREMYETGRTRVVEFVDQARPVVAEKADVAKHKIDDARERLAATVAKSAAATRDVVAEAVPNVVEGVGRAAEAASHGVAVAGDKATHVLDDLARTAERTVEPKLGDA